MKVYISIPISGQEKKARHKAESLKRALSSYGHTVVSPFDVYAGKNPDYEDHICCDLLAMLDCDAVFFCRGWEDSLGCNIEHDVVSRYNAAPGHKSFIIHYEDKR